MKWYCFKPIESYHVEMVVSDGEGYLMFWSDVVTLDRIESYIIPKVMEKLG